MPTKTKYSALLIAKYFIWRAAKDGKTITNKKLQKLLYYAQAWNLVFNKEPLFKENIEAWIHGPAIWSVYKEYKNFGFGDINTKINESEIKEIKEIDLLDSVWKVYGKYDAQYLEALSHAEKPWQEARESIDDSAASRNVIALSSIRDFYQKKLNTASHG